MDKSTNPLSDIDVVCESEVQVAQQPPRLGDVQCSQELDELESLLDRRDLWAKCGPRLPSGSGSSAARNPAAGPTRMRPPGARTAWPQNGPCGLFSGEPFLSRQTVSGTRCTDVHPEPAWQHGSIMAWRPCEQPHLLTTCMYIQILKINYTVRIHMRLASRCPWEPIRIGPQSHNSHSRSQWAALRAQPSPATPLVRQGEGSPKPAR